jgi:hypothetical protein
VDGARQSAGLDESAQVRQGVVEEQEAWMPAPHGIQWLHSRGGSRSGQAEEATVHAVPTTSVISLPE